MEFNLLPELKKTKEKPEFEGTEAKSELHKTEEKPEFEDTEEKPELKQTEERPEFCFICRKPSDSSNPCVQIENGAAFDFLCQLFNSPFLLQPELQLGRIENSEFCEACGQKIREAMLVWTQLKFLEDQLRDMKIELQKTIVKSYKWTLNSSQTLCSAKSVGETIGRLLSQCWSQCRVKMERTVETGQLEQSERRTRKRKKQKEIIDVDDSENDVDAVELLDSSSNRDSPVLKRNHSDVEDVLSDQSIYLYDSTSEEDFSDTEWSQKKTSKTVGMRKRGRPKKNPDVPKPATKRKVGHSDEVEDISSANKYNDGQATSLSNPSLKTTAEARNISEGGTDRSVLKRKRAGRPRTKNWEHSAIAKVLEDQEKQDDLPLTCKTCDEILPSRKFLKEHLQKVHGLDILTLCWHCGHNFETNRTGDPENPFKCDLNGCWRKYKTMADVRRHHQKKCPSNPKVHLNRIFKCDRCDKAYYCASTLHNHIVCVHEKNFSYCCELCGAGFQRQGGLDRHLKSVHSDEKPFQCEVCGKGFKRQHQLFYHRRVHTGERPYVCEQCGKSFITNDKLRCHMSNLHSEASIPCPICGKQFPSVHYVRNHVESTHNRNPKYISRPKGSKRTNEVSEDTEVNAVQPNFVPFWGPSHGML